MRNQKNPTRLTWRWRLVYAAWTMVCWSIIAAFGIMERTTNGGSAFDAQMTKLLALVWFLGFLVLTAIWIARKDRN